MKELVELETLSSGGVERFESFWWRRSGRGSEQGGAVVVSPESDIYRDRIFW